MNPKYYRPVENQDLLGSAAKAKEALGWEPKYTLESLVEEMVLSDIELVKNGRIFSSTNLDWLVADEQKSKDIDESVLSNGKGSEWVVDEAENTEDSGTTSIKGSDWSVAGSENTEDSGIVDSEKTENLDTVKGNYAVAPEMNGLERIIENKLLSSNGKTNGQSLNFAAVHVPEELPSCV